VAAAFTTLDGMPQLRLALAQVDPTVGDLEGNAEQVLRWARHAADQGAHLVAFPEMQLTGYPIEDLALRRSFVEASRAALVRLARRLAEERLGGLVVVVGYLDRVAHQNTGGEEDRADPGVPKGSPLNAAAVLHRGAVVAASAKHHLPNYGVFDEARYFVPGHALDVVRLHGVDVAIAICEDLWQDGGPVSAARAAGARLLLALHVRHLRDSTGWDVPGPHAAETGHSSDSAPDIWPQASAAASACTSSSSSSSNVASSAAGHDDRRATTSRAGSWTNTDWPLMPSPAYTGTSGCTIQSLSR